jgi:hypothetical protein
MKKILSILFALAILLSGMNLTVATHLCGSYHAVTKINFSGKPASCGMRSETLPETSSQTRLASHCCENFIAVYTVDQNYTPSENHVAGIQQPVLHFFVIPGYCITDLHEAPASFFYNGPPPYAMFNSVNRADIGVFRI